MSLCYVKNFNRTNVELDLKPPTYAQPPPTPPTMPPPPPSTGESSGPYGHVERNVNYPDFDQFYDFGGFKQPEDETIYDNHIINEQIYDQAGGGTTTALTPPQLPPR